MPIHQEILTTEQLELLPLIAKFSRNFKLVGGTAIALQIGHRESIDFDLFSTKTFKNLNIKKRISEVRNIDRIIRDEEGQYTIIVNKVYFTFFEYPFEIEYAKELKNVIKMPDLLTLGAMKLHALGRRAKWKDYVDLYFILKDFHSIGEINKKATELFKNEFNEKIVREQLSYFDDIDYRQKVYYKKGFEVDEEVVKKALMEFSLE
jgi:hypothetical protein